MRSSLLTLSALVLASWSLPAQAEDAASPARVLFKQGRDLIAKGDYAAACPKFEQSLALEVGLGTQFNLADCWEHIGRNASAQALFLGAAASAKAVGQTEREQVLRDRATALAPRIAKLVIEVNATDPKLSVKRDQLPIEQESWGKALAIDPGRYEIRAKAPGKKTWTQTVDIKAGESVVSVEVPELEPLADKPPAHPQPAPPPVAPAVAAQPAAPPGGAASDHYGHGPNYKLLGLGALGLGALSFGTVMAFRYRSANDDAAGICPTSVNCTNKEIAQHEKLVERASTARSWTYAGYGVGIASLLGAAAFYVLEQPAKPKPSTIEAAPLLGQAGVYGASLSGAF